MCDVRSQIVIDECRLCVGCLLWLINTSFLKTRQQEAQAWSCLKVAKVRVASATAGCRYLWMTSVLVELIPQSGKSMFISDSTPIHSTSYYISISHLPQPSLSSFPYTLYIILFSSSMRVPTWTTFVKTFYTFSNITTHRVQSIPALSPFNRTLALKSMPTIPFLGSLFSTSSSNNMSYPVQKTDDEWQAVLSKGMPRLSHHDILHITL